jgi:hypothetical protein
MRVAFEEDTQIAFCLKFIIIMILFGQILLISSYILLEIRTYLLRKVDANRRIRKNMPPCRKLYKGRVVYYLFEFEKRDETDTKEDIAKILKVNIIDKVSGICFIGFVLILLYLIVVEDYSLLE